MLNYDMPWGFDLPDRVDAIIESTEHRMECSNCNVIVTLWRTTVSDLGDYIEAYKAKMIEELGLS
jgi:hypothetical protein